MSSGIILFFGFCFGIGFGFFAQRSGLCFAHGLGEIFIGKGKRFFKLFLTIFIITIIGFQLLIYLDPTLWQEAWQKTGVTVRGFGFYNILAGLLFGAGMFINGGCVIGTLRQIGEGSVVHIITILGMLPGLAFVAYILKPFLKPLYNAKKIFIQDVTGVSALYVTTVMVLIATGCLLLALRKKL